MEVYAGRTKELVKCEGYLREILELIHQDYSGKVTSKRQVTREAAPCKNLENELAKFFGIKSLSIYWTNGSINAYSIPGSSILIAERNNKDDFTTAKFHICIYENLVYDAGLNEQELMAVILHEIGHCFYSSGLLVASELLSYIIQPMNIVLNFVGVSLMKLGNKISEFEKRKLPFIYNLFRKFDHFLLEIDFILKYITIIPNPYSIAYGVGYALSDPLGTLGRYGGERGADSFAAKYGYGAEQISALKKLQRPENVGAVKALNNMGGFGDFIMDYNEIITDLFGMLSLDPHPNSDVRAQAMIRKLKRDLASGTYPPGLKNDLQKEIARLEKIYSTINDNKSNVEIKKAWYNMLNFITDGHSNIQEILNSYYEDKEF